MDENTPPLSKIAADYAAACRTLEWAVQNTEEARTKMETAERIEADARERQRIGRIRLLQAAEHDTPTNTTTEN